MADSRNMGAVQHKKPPCIPGYSALLSDTSQDNKRYPICFRWYATWEEAADDLVRQVFTIRASVWRDVVGAASVSRAAWSMYATNYYGGFTRDATTNVRVYTVAIMPGLAASATYLGVDPRHMWADWDLLLALEALED